MPIELTCSQCGRKLRVADDAAGKQARCPACNHISRVPMPAVAGVGPTAPVADTLSNESAAGYPPPKPAPLENPFSDSDSQPYAQSPFASQGVNPFGDHAPVKDTGNPYQTPVTYGYQTPSAHQYPLASRGKRLAGAIVDSVIYMVAAAPGAIAIFAADANNSDVLAMLGVVLVGVAVLAVAVINWVMISKNGQSIAKRLLGMRIVLLQTGQAPGFVNGVLLRSWVPALINQACSLFGLIDALWIFNEERRCIHDLIAQTVVVDV